MVSSYEDYKRAGYEDYFDDPQYGDPHQSSGGAWFIREQDREFLSLIRITGPKDQTYRERTPYDPDCGACWLGHAHSGDYHRAYLGQAVEYVMSVYQWFEVGQPTLT